MRSELRDNWITALRSGNYKQGKGALREKNGYSGDNFCCLGVLIDIVADERWIDIEATSEGENIQAYFTDEHGHEDQSAEGELEGDLKDVCDLTQVQAEALISLNDGVRFGSTKAGDGAVRSEIDDSYAAGKEPQNFNVIADYIEANL